MITETKETQTLKNYIDYMLNDKMKLKAIEEKVKLNHSEID